MRNYLCLWIASARVFASPRFTLEKSQRANARDRRATLRLGNTVSDSILGGEGGGTRHFFLLTLYNVRNIGGRGPRTPSPPPAPRSLNADPRRGRENFLFLRQRRRHFRHTWFCFALASAFLV